MDSKFSKSQASSEVRKRIFSGLAQVIIDIFKSWRKARRMSAAPECSSLSSPTASWWSRGSFFTISRMSAGLRVAMRPTCATWWSGGIAPPPFHWTLVTFETRYQLVASKLDFGHFQNHMQMVLLSACFMFRSPPDFSNLFLFYIHETTTGMPQSMPFHVLPDHAGHITVTPCFNAKSNCPQTFLPFPQHLNCLWD